MPNVSYIDNMPQTRTKDREPMGESTNSGGGIGFCGLLAIVFITMKLTGHIDWSWWWVLSPLWLPAAILLSIGLVCLLIAGIVTIFEGVWK
jgi:hypothetical protein